MVKKVQVAHGELLPMIDQRVADATAKATDHLAITYPQTPDSRNRTRHR